MSKKHNNNDIISTKITRFGYIIDKKKYDNDKIENIKSDLVMEPIIQVKDL